VETGELLVRIILMSRVWWGIGLCGKKKGNDNSIRQTGKEGSRRGIGTGVETQNSGAARGGVTPIREILADGLNLEKRRAREQPSGL